MATHVFADEAHACMLGRHPLLQLVAFCHSAVSVPHHLGLVCGLALVTVRVLRVRARQLGVGFGALVQQLSLAWGSKEERLGHIVHTVRSRVLRLILLDHTMVV